MTSRNSMMQLKRFIIYILYLFLLGNSVLAQDPVLRHFSVEDGLPGGNIYFCMQDSRGHIWSATDRGVVRFDGDQFKVFTTKDGLPSNDVWQIEEDKQGRLWLSTFNEICYIENGKIKIFDSDILPEEKGKVNHYFTLLGHFVWMALPRTMIKVDDQLNIVFRDDRPRKYMLSGGFSIMEDDKNSSLFNDLKLRMAVVETEPLLLLNRTAITKNSEAIHQISNERSIEMIANVSLSDTKVLFAMSDKINLISNNQVQPIQLSHLGIDTDIHKISRVTRIAANKIWIKTNAHELIVDTSFQVVPGFDFLNDYSINSLLFDKQQNLWIATNNGLFFLNEKGLRSKTFTIQSESKSENIQFLATNQQKEIWALSTEGFLYKLESGQGLVAKSDRSLVEVPKDILFDRDGNLWIAGKLLYRVLAKNLDTHQIKQSPVYSTKSQSNIASVKRLHSRNNNNLLLSTFIKLIEIQDNDRIKDSYICTGRFYGIAELKNRNIWLSGKSGLQLVNRQGEKLNFKENIQNPIFNYPIDNIVLDKHEKLWLAANNRGVYRLTENSLDSIPELENILVQSLYLDAKNSLWVCTNKGLAKVKPLALNPFRYSFQWVTEIDGLASNDVKEVLIENGEIYVATGKGLTVLQDLEEEAKNNYAPFRFSGVSINGRDTSIQEHYMLKHDQNNLVIKFQNLDFENMGRMVFQYKMEGIDENWNDTRLFQKEYSLLAPGDYTFKVRKKNVNSSKEPDELLMRFQINRPFWENGSFLFFLAMLAGGLIYWLYNDRIKKIEKRAEEENKLNQKFAELELRALQSQMNPHFVFNALHAIQDFIFKKDERVANRYLVKFSRLMRLFLESSKEKFILLEDEIQLLQLYIELEKLRFEDKFDFEIEIADNLSPGMVEVPSMLLQPFVENAINHGLIHRSERGKLLLNFTKEKGKLHCRIEDNGIGRKKAAEIKSQSIKSYKSRGMQLVEERQEIWNRIGYATIDIAVEDLYNEDGVGVGTRVDVFVNLGD